MLAVAVELVALVEQVVVAGLLLGRLRVVSAQVHLFSIDGILKFEISAEIPQQPVPRLKTRRKLQ